MNIKYFDKYVELYRDLHNKDETITMLRVHRDYLNYCKYNYSVKTIKQYENKINHINKLLREVK